MITFDTGGHRFQLRAAAIIVDDGHLLLHRLEGDPFWALPGGRVEPGEDGATTVVREMVEETGEAVTCGALRFVVENFFEGERGMPAHEIGLYFEARLAAGSRLGPKHASHAGIEGSARLEFRWFALDTLADLDFHPAVLREAIARPVAGTHHLLQRG
jgi:8-oxo-dGTP pyrophosphatase MutT (NUDIX family)